MCVNLTPDVLCLFIISVPQYLVLCVFIIYCLVGITLSSVPFSLFLFLCIILPRPPRSSQKEEEGGEEEEEEEVEVMCLPASGCNLELYTPEPLYRHQPIEAPVSPRKYILKNNEWKKKVFTFTAELLVPVSQTLLSHG